MYMYMLMCPHMCVAFCAAGSVLRILCILHEVYCTYAYTYAYT